MSPPEPEGERTVGVDGDDDEELGVHLAVRGADDAKAGHLQGHRGHVVVGEGLGDGVGEGALAAVQNLSWGGERRWGGCGRRRNVGDENGGYGTGDV